MSIATMRPLLTLFTAAAFLYPALSDAQALVGQFVRDLRQGSRGEDVRDLQQLLNRDPSTSLESAPGEAGSAGYETAYFGTLTFAAVIRFQNKYALEILAPIDLDQGTGFVGPRTRAVMNRLLASPETSGLTPVAPPQVVTPLPDWQAPQPPVSPLPAPPVVPPVSPPIAPPVTGVELNTTVDIYAGDGKLSAISARLNDEMAKFKATRVVPQLDARSLASDFTMYLNGKSAFMGRVGTSLTLSGAGFAATGNSVHFGSQYVVRNVASPSGTSLSVAVPDIPPGRYDVAVSNSGGVTNTGIFIVNGATLVPVIVNNVTPATVRFGEEIVVYGSGFTPTGNEVRTNVAAFKNLPSTDGTSIRVNVAPELLREAFELPPGQKRPFSMQVVVYVINNNGMSTTAKFFTLTL